MKSRGRTKSWCFDYYIRRVARVFGRVADERVKFYRTHGYWPHLRHPRTFNEKICHRKLFSPLPAATLLADKYAVRKHVAVCGYPDILTKILLATKNPDDIDFSKLPDRFVIKANHGCGWNILVKDKKDIDQNAVIAQSKQWMASTYGEKYNEFHYKDISPLILIEEFLYDEQHVVPPDYRFYVFHGRCHFIQVEYGRLSEHTRTIYNREWQPQSFAIRYPQKIVEEEPATLKKMIEIAEALVGDLNFARVDLYSVNGKIYFGEITLTPAAGGGRFYPTSEGDFLMGGLW